jgi:hypothetical protein
MTQCAKNRFRLISAIVLCALILATPTGRALVLALVVHIAEVGAKILHLPCQFLDHSKCFTLDNMDPTCPPYL